MACPKHIHSTLHGYPLYKSRGSAASAALPLPMDFICPRIPAGGKQFSNTPYSLYSASHSNPGSAAPPDTLPPFSPLLSV